MHGDGVLFRKIIALEGPAINDLPELYSQGYPRVSVHKGEELFLWMSQKQREFFETGEEIREADFQGMLSRIAVAVDRYHVVERELEGLRSTWNGEETFEI